MGVKNIKNRSVRQTLIVNDGLEIHEFQDTHHVCGSLCMYAFELPF